MVAGPEVVGDHRFAVLGHARLVLVPELERIPLGLRRGHHLQFRGRVRERVGPAPVALRDHIDIGRIQAPQDLDGVVAPLLVVGDDHPRVLHPVPVRLGFADGVVLDLVVDLQRMAAPDHERGALAVVESGFHDLQVHRQVGVGNVEMVDAFSVDIHAGIRGVCRGAVTARRHVVRPDVELDHHLLALPLPVVGIVGIAVGLQALAHPVVRAAVVETGDGNPGTGNGNVLGLLRRRGVDPLEIPPASAVGADGGGIDADIGGTGPVGDVEAARHHVADLRVRAQVGVLAADTLGDRPEHAGKVQAAGNDRAEVAVALVGLEVIPLPGRHRRSGREVGGSVFDEGLDLPGRGGEQADGVDAHPLVLDALRIGDAAVRVGRGEAAASGVVVALIILLVDVAGLAVGEQDDGRRALVVGIGRRVGIDQFQGFRHGGRRVRSLVGVAEVAATQVGRVRVVLRGRGQDVHVVVGDVRPVRREVGNLQELIDILRVEVRVVVQKREIVPPVDMLGRGRVVVIEQSRVQDEGDAVSHLAVLQDQLVVVLLHLLDEIDDGALQGGDVVAGQHRGRVVQQEDDVRRDAALHDGLLPGGESLEGDRIDSVGGSGDAFCRRNATGCIILLSALGKCRQGASRHRKECENSV